MKNLPQDLRAFNKIILGALRGIGLFLLLYILVSLFVIFYPYSAFIATIIFIAYMVVSFARTQIT
jgi:hypothetical protein